MFSGYCDEIGIRRHSLRPDTVRVLTLLRSMYCTEDDVDKTLIKEAMKLDLDTLRNSILWRPDDIYEEIDEGNTLNLPLNIIC